MTASREAVEARLDELQRLHPKLIDLSLERLTRLLARLGDPHRRLPPTIHVAGTNGKGSTVAFLRAGLEAAGQRVHVYTSPHLVRFNERIRLGRRGRGELVGDAVLLDALERCEKANAGEPITLFEITTATAFLLFSEHPADALLLEVGLGGRFDATNVIAAPEACVITPVSVDHVEYLGETAEKIAFEKAGILKPGARAIFAAQSRDALAALEREAARRGMRPKIGDEDFHGRLENGRFVYEDEDGLLDLPAPKLPGRHQLVNAATAVATLRTLRPELPAETFERMMLDVEWPARMQSLQRGRIAAAAAGAEIWLDGGHNEDGGRALAEALADLAERSDRPLAMICGMLTTKDSSGFLRAFKGLAQEMIAVPVSASAAGRPPLDLAAAARAAGHPAVAAPSLAAALDYLRARAWKTAPRIVICGSLYLAGEALAFDGTAVT
ncbi:MAG: bifunctional folylpolyglutamate synthase/dihydrofolate synthase [Rhodoblastus sp.]|nr:MAG: bifunctional folylpolyglutamate synthase/dihydrofolate synthase [Rhodoblastus sp.]